MDRRVLVVTFAPLIAIAYLIYAFWHLPWTPVRIAALVVSILCVAALTAARIELGNSFSIKPEARKLVTSGIYSKVRHPVYVFSAIATAAMILYVSQPKLLLAFVVIIPMQVLRARAEERVLEQKFGDEYRRYRATTIL